MRADVPLPETKAPYLVLENMSSMHSKGVYVISLAGRKALKLGRGHESDVRIADVSISRWHATVSIADDGRFILEDHNSKFGTLVAMRRPKLINASTGDDVADASGPILTVQAGRTVFRISTRKPSGTRPHSERNRAAVCAISMDRSSVGLNSHLAWLRGVCLPETQGKRVSAVARTTSARLLGQTQIVKAAATSGKYSTAKMLGSTAAAMLLNPGSAEHVYEMLPTPMNLCFWWGIRLEYPALAFGLGSFAVLVCQLITGMVLQPVLKAGGNGAEGVTADKIQLWYLTLI
ncbi:hypothetical protein Pmar_PMAR028002 [Perkinsus marinus ATCC 50983]|uniref:FHA domain-containing protein n=1 Tax=Perkinsus marinus (strain ATCC 50983 / TXsc) TaxID=423536 RepID=C5LVA1_PERM5|nr:hypothetical protein Pmar_PMAR028002 [Perkinsus marinus ATCC 50983]EEQ99339.1 hypothetical protein Pmar_PMAR028002 [Perkinsus marinus ATCC 50983]|eukprot:XP_002766622.1 hypothetical protein Pmar_PMAR028002 [Perkinsus marinus ATCC 50983]